MGRKKSVSIETIKQELTSPRHQHIGSVANKDLLGTGSTLLNLALSGRLDGGFAKGFVILLIGKPRSGKSWLSFNAMAEASISKEFADYRLIYDNPENGAHMDVKQYFGERLLEKLEPPAGTVEEPEHSATVEDFYYNLDDALKRGKPFLYVLDSMDALSSEDDDAQFQKEKNAAKKDKEVGGSYGTSKAKANSKYLRVVTNKIAKSGSIVVIICQTRDNIGFSSRFNPETYSGGKSLGFYARQVLWTSTKERIKSPYRDKQVDVGGITQVKVTKNSISGWEGIIEFPISRFVGIDDTGSLVDFLVEWKHWKKNNGIVSAIEWELSLRRETLIEHIESEDLEEDLKTIVLGVWKDIEEATRIVRKKRY